jgi:hypothetical protein
MSTISLSYPDITRARRVPAAGKNLILAGFVLVAVAVLILGVSTSNTEPAGGAAISQTAIAPVAVPVPMPSSMEIQSGPTGTPTLSLEETSGPVIIPVAVPAPPAS